MKSRLTPPPAKNSKTIVRFINTFAIIFRVKSIPAASRNGANFLGTKTKARRQATCDGIDTALMLDALIV